MILPNEFKARLTLLDMTQQQFADYLDINVRTVQKWLNETTIPKYALICLEHIELLEKLQREEYDKRDR